MGIQRKVCACGKSFFTARNGVVLCKTCRQDQYQETWHQKRSRILLKCEGSHTKEQWKLKIAEYHNRCAYCDSSLINAVGQFMGERDHRVPICRGGSDSIENIVPSCRACNLHKRKMTYLEYKAKFPTGAPQNYRLPTVPASTDPPPRVLVPKNFIPDQRLILGADGTPAQMLFDFETCLAHPLSGKTLWSTCWECYTERCRLAKKPPQLDPAELDEGNPIFLGGKRR